MQRHRGGRSPPGDEERVIPEIPPRIKALEPDFSGSGDELVADALYRRGALACIRANPGREASLAAVKGFFFLVAGFIHPIQRRRVVYSLCCWRSSWGSPGGSAGAPWIPASRRSGWSSP